MNRPLRNVLAHVHQPDLGILLLRLMIGIIGFYHGSQKLFGLFDGPGIEGFAGFLSTLDVPMPQVSAVLAGVAEFFGGILVAIGLLTRLAAIPFAFAMVVGIITVHPDAFAASKGGMEFALSVAIMLTAVFFTGAGRYSVDAALFPRLAPRLG